MTRRRIGILQPGYLPWLGFFEQMDSVDVFVVYDDVAYDKQGWRNRNRIKTANGVLWLTVPVHADFSETPRILNVRIDNRRDWRKKHMRTIEQSYAKAPCAAAYLPPLRAVYDEPWERLVDLDVRFVRILAEALGIRSEVVRSSELGIEGDDRIDRLIRICRALDGAVFYEGASGRDYIDEERFLEAGVQVEYQSYAHPTYRQLHGEFVPYLSVVDLLLNHGPESLDILRSGAERSETS